MQTPVQPVSKMVHMASNTLSMVQHALESQAHRQAGGYGRFGVRRTKTLQLYNLSQPGQGWLRQGRPP